MCPFKFVWDPCICILIAHVCLFFAKDDTSGCCCCCCCLCCCCLSTDCCAFIVCSYSFCGRANCSLVNRCSVTVVGVVVVVVDWVSFETTHSLSLPGIESTLFRFGRYFTNSFEVSEKKVDFVVILVFCSCVFVWMRLFVSIFVFCIIVSVSQLIAKSEKCIFDLYILGIFRIQCVGE